MSAIGAATFGRTRTTLAAAMLNPPNRHRETLRRARQEAARKKLTNFLTANRGTATYIIAVPNANVAAPLILATGQPVMAMGGYLGDDPILTPQSLQRLVAEGRLRYVMLGGFTLVPGSTALRPIETWVRDHGRLVDPLEWGIYRTRKGAPYYIPLGSRWVAVPPPELYDLAACSPASP
jgi:4-amino-4-deoxy-L-arabinose transferase-like glycosyltransferase